MSQTPLLLVPGLNCTAELWWHPVSRLGAGRAVMVADHSCAETIAEIASAILADAPPRFVLAGLSMGGYVAMEIMRVAPERVERLALLDTQARADTPEASEQRRQTIAIAEGGGFNKIAAMQYPRLVAPSRGDDEALQAVVRRMADATGAAAFVREQKAIMSRIDSRPSLSAISCPTIVVVGSQDQLTPPHFAEEMAAAIPTARLMVIEGAGHLTPLEAPEETTAVLVGLLSE